MVPIRVLIAASIAAALLAEAAPAAAQTKPEPGGATGAICVDKELADKLAVKRRRRGRDPRDFVKAQRHEISTIGGYYVSDLFSGTYALGASYTYHMTEEAAVEASFLYTHADAELARAIEGGRAETIEDPFAMTTFVSSMLIWSPLHGKLRAGGSIVHFDLHFDLGVGVVDSPTSRGAAGIAGFGVKLFGGKWFAFRIDARDHVYRQELLEERFLVNDLSLTAGLSVFLPFGF
jgi:outer membrane beta-barrel protein